MQTHIEKVKVELNYISISYAKDLCALQRICV